MCVLEPSESLSGKIYGVFLWGLGSEHLPFEQRDPGNAGSFLSNHLVKKLLDTWNDKGWGRLSIFHAQAERRKALERSYQSTAPGKGRRAVYLHNHEDLFSERRCVAVLEEPAKVSAADCIEKSIFA